MNQKIDSVFLLEIIHWQQKAVILIRKILFTIKPKHFLVYNKYVAAYENRTYQKTPQTIHIIYLGLIRSVCVGIAIFQSIPIIVWGLFHIGHPVQ